MDHTWPKRTGLNSEILSQEAGVQNVHPGTTGSL